jgi:hypothetical protein
LHEEAMLGNRILESIRRPTSVAMAAEPIARVENIARGHIVAGKTESNNQDFHESLFIDSFYVKKT